MDFFTVPISGFADVDYCVKELNIRLYSLQIPLSAIASFSVFDKSLLVVYQNEVEERGYVEGDFVDERGVEVPKEQVSMFTAPHFDGVKEGLAERGIGKPGNTVQRVNAIVAFDKKFLVIIER
tara:strand:+ start:107 stop:475 length:369 start_codon:yes stop_codon:yes gene_type:complete